MGSPSLPVKTNYYHFPSEEGPCSLSSHLPYFRQWLLRSFSGQWKNQRLFSLQADVPVSAGGLAALDKG